MFKRIAAAVLAFVMVLTLMPKPDVHAAPNFPDPDVTVSYAQVGAGDLLLRYTEDNIEYSLNTSTGALTMSLRAQYPGNTLRIPAYVGGAEVKNVSLIQSAGNYSDNIRTIVVPAGVSLKAITIAKNLETLAYTDPKGENANAGHEKDILLYDAYTTRPYTIMGSAAIRMTHLSEVRFAEGLTELASGALSDAPLTSVKLPATLETVGGGALNISPGTWGGGIAIPGSVKTLDQSSIRGRYDVCFSEGLQSMGLATVDIVYKQALADHDYTYIIPSTVSTIGSNAISMTLADGNVWFGPKDTFSFDNYNSINLRNHYSSKDTALFNFTFTRNLTHTQNYVRPVNSKDGRTGFFIGPLPTMSYRFIAPTSSSAELLEQWKTYLTTNYDANAINLVNALPANQLDYSVGNTYAKADGLTVAQYKANYSALSAAYGKDYYYSGDSTVMPLTASFYQPNGLGWAMEYQWEVSTDGGTHYYAVSGATGLSYTPSVGYAGGKDFLCRCRARVNPTAVQNEFGLSTAPTCEWTYSEVFTIHVVKSLRNYSGSRSERYTVNKILVPNNYYSDLDVIKDIEEGRFEYFLSTEQAEGLHYGQIVSEVNPYARLIGQDDYQASLVCLDPNIQPQSTTSIQYMQWEKRKSDGTYEKVTDKKSNSLMFFVKAWEGKLYLVPDVKQVGYTDYYRCKVITVDPRATDSNMIVEYVNFAIDYNAPDTVQPAVKTNRPVSFTYNPSYAPADWTSSVISVPVNQDMYGTNLRISFNFGIGEDPSVHRDTDAVRYEVTLWRTGGTSGTVKLDEMHRSDVPGYQESLPEDISWAPISNSNDYTFWYEDHPEAFPLSVPNTYYYYAVIGMWDQYGRYTRTETDWLEFEVVGSGDSFIPKAPHMALPSTGVIPGQAITQRVQDVGASGDIYAIELDRKFTDSNRDAYMIDEASESARMTSGRIDFNPSYDLSQANNELTPYGFTLSTSYKFYYDGNQDGILDDYEAITEDLTNAYGEETGYDFVEGDVDNGYSLNLFYLPEDLIDDFLIGEYTTGSGVSQRFYRAYTPDTYHFYCECRDDVYDANNALVYSMKTQSSPYIFTVKNDMSDIRYVTDGYAPRLEVNEFPGARYRWFTFADGTPNLVLSTTSSLENPKVDTVYCCYITLPGDTTGTASLLSGAIINMGSGYRFTTEAENLLPFGIDLLMDCGEGYLEAAGSDNIPAGGSPRYYFDAGVEIPWNYEDTAFYGYTEYRKDYFNSDLGDFAPKELEAMGFDPSSRRVWSFNGSEFREITDADKDPLCVESGRGYYKDLTNGENYLFLTYERDPSSDTRVYTEVYEYDDGTLGGLTLGVAGTSNMLRLKEQTGRAEELHITASVNGQPYTSDGIHAMELNTAGTSMVVPSDGTKVMLDVDHAGKDDPNRRFLYYWYVSEDSAKVFDPASSVYGLPASGPQGYIDRMGSLHSQSSLSLIMRNYGVEAYYGDDSNGSKELDMAYGDHTVYVGVQVIECGLVRDDLSGDGAYAYVWLKNDDGTAYASASSAVLTVTNEGMPAAGALPPSISVYGYYSNVYPGNDFRISVDYRFDENATADRTAGWQYSRYDNATGLWGEWMDASWDFDETDGTMTFSPLFREADGALTKRDGFYSSSISPTEEFYRLRESGNWRFRFVAANSLENKSGNPYFDTGSAVSRDTSIFVVPKDMLPMSFSSDNTVNKIVRGDTEASATAYTYIYWNRDYSYDRPLQSYRLYLSADDLLDAGDYEIYAESGDFGDYTYCLEMPLSELMGYAADAGHDVANTPGTYYFFLEATKEVTDEIDPEYICTGPTTVTGNVRFAALEVLPESAQAATPSITNIRYAQNESCYSVYVYDPTSTDYDAAVFGAPIGETGYAASYGIITTIHIPDTGTGYCSYYLTKDIDVAKAFMNGTMDHDDIETQLENGTIGYATRSYVETHANAAIMNLSEVPSEFVGEPFYVIVEANNFNEEVKNDALAGYTGDLSEAPACNAYACAVLKDGSAPLALTVQKAVPDTSHIESLYETDAYEVPECNKGTFKISASNLYYDNDGVFYRSEGTKLTVKNIENGDGLLDGSDGAVIEPPEYGHYDNLILHTSGNASAGAKATITLQVDAYGFEPFEIIVNVVAAKEVELDGTFTTTTEGTTVTWSVLQSQSFTYYDFIVAGYDSVGRMVDAKIYEDCASYDTTVRETVFEATNITEVRIFSLLHSTREPITDRYIVSKT